MQQNAEDGGKRQFILVQIPQPIDAKKQKEAHHFVTDTLGHPDATIFEITAERIRRAGAKLQAERAAKRPPTGDLLPDDTPALDTGFRVFELTDDPDALILQTSLAEATQADIATLQTTIVTPQPAQLQRILYNLLLAEGLPLSTPIVPVPVAPLPDTDGQPSAPCPFYRADTVLFIVHAVDTEVVREQLAALTAAGTPVTQLSVYAPWVHDNNFLMGVKTLLETLGWSEDKLRLRG